MKTKRFISAQNKISAVFTLLFLLAVLILSAYLKMSADAIEYNARARAIYAETRQLYQAKTYLLQFERALNYFEVLDNEDFLDQYNSSFSRLQQNLVNAAESTYTEEEEASLQQLIQATQEMRSKFDLVVAAARNEDWESVVVLDKDAYVLVKQIFTQLDDLIAIRTQRLEDLRSQIDSFATWGWVSIGLSVPVFVIMIGFVALIITRQINAPLIRMTDELKLIEADQFSADSLGDLPERQDEVGYLVREYLQMANATQERQVVLQQQVAELRSKIR